MKKDDYIHKIQGHKLDNKCQNVIQTFKFLVSIFILKSILTASKTFKGNRAKLNRKHYNQIFSRQSLKIKIQNHIM